MKPWVVVVDDEDTIRNLLKSRLSRDGFEVALASSADEAQKVFSTKAPVGVLVTDLKMPGKDGFALMTWAKQNFSKVRVIVITGHGEKEVAVKALRQGASDYLEKPFDMDELSHTVKRCLHEFGLEQENHELLARLEARIERVEGKSEDKYWFVSKSEAMSKVNEWLTILRREAMRGNAEEPTCLILGESGTGKEGIARMIHAGSRRGKGPWVAVNCANFNDQLLESELFGHERGAFTGATNLKRGLFEIAKGGTLFLDEIGEMDIKLQAKLLRVLQEKVFRRVGGTTDIESDVRVIAATNRNLQARARDGHFRDDVYHRLNQVCIELPALRDRKEDLIPMASELAERSFRSRGKKFAGFTEDAEAAIRAYSWPGNVREMLNLIERTSLIVNSPEAKIEARTLGLPSGGAPSLSKPSLSLVENGGAEIGYTELKKHWSDSFEKEYLVSMLAKHQGNVSAAAREAKLDRSNFLRLLRRHGLKAQEYRKVVGETAQAA